MSEEKNKVYGWDDEWEVENDGSEFFEIVNGEYPFTISAFERGHFEGGKKTPECNKATYTLAVQGVDKDGNIGMVQVRDDFMLTSSWEWKISALMRAVGDKKRGEKAKFKFNEMVGKTGICKIKRVAGKKEDVTFANIDKYVDKDELKEAKLFEEYSVDDVEEDWG